MKFRNMFAATLIAASGLMATAPAKATNVGLELALLIDVSGSVDGTEYNLQRQGYINAFQNAAIHAAIAGITGGIAVTYIEWSSSNEQATLVGWTHITDAASSNAFAALIAGTSRAFSGLTAPGSAINYVTPLFNNSFDGLRQVIDVSGDGSENDGANTAAARAAALAAGVDAINGLAIGAGLLPWYTANIVGGTNAFAIGVDSFGDFGDAVLVKIGREITGAPEPGTLALLGLGLLGLGAARRRKA